MPFIKSKVSCPVSAGQERELKARLGKAIERIPGKSEGYLFLEFENGCHIWLHGDSEQPVAYLEAAVYGVDDHAGYAAFAQEAAQAYGEVLGIPPENFFLKFEDISSCSAAGRFFDRRA